MNLTPSQKIGLDMILSNTGHVAICGPAGTGKTFLLRAVLEHISGNIVFCAPTHQAKNVLGEMLNKEAKTIHSVLRIHPDTYEDVVNFTQSDGLDLSEVDYLVVDEISMIDNDLFGIMMTSVPPKCRIIGMGDPYQLQPVKHDSGMISPVFNDPRFMRVTLTEIVRQSEDNPLIQVATNIRVNSTRVYDNNNGELGTFRITDKVEYLRKYFSVVKTPEDTLKHKIIAYTNEIVDSMNTFTRKRIYNTTEEIVVGEYFVCQSPVKRKIRHNGKNHEETVFNNGETIKVIDIIGHVEDIISLRDVDIKAPKIKFWKVKAKSIDTDEEYVIHLILDEGHDREYKHYLNNVAEEYKRIKRVDPGKNMKAHWKNFWNQKDFFTEVKGSAACTIHKSQGSTFENVFYLSNRIEYTTPAIRKQLEYVAVTRAKYNVYYN